MKTDRKDDRRYHNHKKQTRNKFIKVKKGVQTIYYAYCTIVTVVRTIGTCDVGL